MLIVNPIYDTVFKYTMKNLDIARGVISAIIGEEIDHLDFQARENVHEKKKKFTFFHIDFKARIKEAGSGRYKDVLIELQKTYSHTDIALFIRNYKENCRQEEEMILRNGESNRQNIPLITIYFLGLKLSETLPGVIKVNRQRIDMLTGKEITERNEFIECLPHDSYVIQIPSLKPGIKTRLEHILSIFLQEKFIREDRHLKDYPYTPKDELTRKILKRLEMAAADGELHRQLELEEMAAQEYESVVAPYEAKLREKDVLLEKSKKLIEKSEKLIEKFEIHLEKKDELLGKKDELLGQKDKLIEEKDKTIEEKDKTIRELLAKLKKRVSV